jgi:tubulin--tyrosine ligase
VALHNLYHGAIDLLVRVPSLFIFKTLILPCQISGPNLGRNTSGLSKEMCFSFRILTSANTIAAFALSSGTVGAALSSSLSQIRSIAVSYGTVVHPTPSAFREPAHRLAAGIVNHLWSNWGKDEAGLRNGEVDLYNLNIPMIEQLLTDEGLTIVWTTMWRNSYGRLFKVVLPDAKSSVSPAGPDLATADPVDETQCGIEVPSEDVSPLVFRFAPDMRGLINPLSTSVPVGSDGWAMLKGYVSITPLRASFAEPLLPPEGDGERAWKIKL